MSNKNLFKKIGNYLSNLISLVIEEYKAVLKDVGIIVLFFLATLLYPLLYGYIYKNDVLREIPIAVVNESNSAISRYLVRQLDATPDANVVVHCKNMEEAKNVFEMRKVHGIVFIPRDFNNKINNKEQATISIYCDMSSFMYYRTLLTACSHTIIQINNNIQIERLNKEGVVAETANVGSCPIISKGNILYNPEAGFGSFLLPAILILIIHQTLFFGISMRAGTAREENKFHQLIPLDDIHKNILNVVIGKIICYFSLYFVFSSYILGIIPRLFNLPHIGNPTDLILFIVPFLFATIFFSMTISVLIKNRETGMVVFLFFSVVLLFMSGFSWPRSNISEFWFAFSQIFPSTHGIQAYIKINSMGANINQLRPELIALWAQTAFYFLTTLVVYGSQVRGSIKRERLLIESQIK